MMIHGGRGPAGFARRPVPARVLLVTGMSGAGRSTALKTREDITSGLSVMELRRLLCGHFALAGSGLRLFVTSFAYRHGVPRAADRVFDVRFFEDPHYGARLRPLCGCDPPVAAHIASDAELKPFFDRLWRLLRPLLPRYEREGKAYRTIAIGCTDGRHRSVFVAERLAARLRSEDLPVAVAHRDLPAIGAPAPVAAR